MSHLKLVVEGEFGNTDEAVLVLAESLYYRTGEGKLVQIWQTIEEKSVSWYAGYRFIDHNGVLYNEKGVTSKWFPQFNIVEEVDIFSNDVVSPEEFAALGDELTAAIERIVNQADRAAFFHRNLVPFLWGCTTGMVYALGLSIRYKTRRTA